MGDLPPLGSNPNPSVPPAGQSPKSAKRQIVSVSAEFSGPLPRPSVLQGYESVLSGAADRIISMAEKQSEHRKEMERLATNAGIEAMHREFDEARWAKFARWSSLWRLWAEVFIWLK